MRWPPWSRGCAPTSSNTRSSQGAWGSTPTRYALGTDLVQELETICVDLVKDFRRPVVFAGQLVFERENLLTRTLHHGTAFSIHRRLQFVGIQVIVLPIRVWQRSAAA